MSSHHAPVSSKRLDKSIYTFTGIASGVLNLVLLVAPVLAIKLTTDLGFSEGEIGTLLSLELGAFALATIPAYLWLSRLDIRTAFYLFGVIAFAGNVASGFFEDFGPLAVSRVITAFAAGSMTVIILSIGGKASKPTRAFGLWVLSQALFGAIVLFIFPAIYVPLPLAAIYWTSAGLLIPLLLMVRMLPGDLLRTSKGQDQQAVGKSDLPRFFAGLISVLLLNAAGIAVWVFVGQIGVEAGISVDSISFAIGVATVVALVGPVVAILVGESKASWALVAGGFVVAMIGTWMLIGLTNALTFAIAVTLLNLGWQGVPPYLFAGVAASTNSPHALSTLNLFIGIAFTTGPVIAGQILQATGSSTPLLVTAIIVLGVAGLLGVFNVLIKRQLTPIEYERV